MKFRRKFLVVAISLLFIFPLYLANSALAEGVLFLSKLKNSPWPKINNNFNEINNKALLDEYFPHKKEDILSWQIKIVVPFGAQSYHKIFWPVGNDYIRIVPHADGLADAKGLSKPEDGYRLIIKIGERTLIPNPLVKTYGNRINILRDDAGIYQSTRELYWVVDYENLLAYEFMVLKNKLDFDHRQDKNIKNGFAFHILFHLGNSFDSYYYNGCEEDKLSLMAVLFNEGRAEGRFFVRKIMNGRTTLFTESLIYHKGLGLKTLIQYFKDDITMKWERLP